MIYWGRFMKTTPQSRRRTKTTRKQIAPAPALERGLCILEDMHAQPTDQSVSAIAERLDFPINSTLRLLVTLESKGYVERDPDSLKYRLTRKPAGLALSGGRERSLLEVALPLMRDLRDVTSESVLLSIIEHGVGIVLEQIQSTHVFRFVCNPGAQHALHAAAPAKAILASLPHEEREQTLANYTFARFTASTITTREAFDRELACGKTRGYWEDNAEEFDGICCVAAPVFNRLGYPIAAVTVTGPTNRIGADERAKFGLLTVESARVISRSMGYALFECDE